MKDELRLKVPPLSGLERLLRCSTRSAWVMRLLPAPAPLLLDVVGVKLKIERTDRFKNGTQDRLQDVGKAISAILPSRAK